MNAVTDVASQATPVFVGEYPRACCISSVRQEDEREERAEGEERRQVGGDQRAVPHRGGGDERAT